MSTCCVRGSAIATGAYSLVDVVALALVPIDIFLNCISKRLFFNTFRLIGMRLNKYNLWLFYLFGNFTSMLFDLFIIIIINDFV